MAMNLRLSEEQDFRLGELAKAEGRSKQSVIAQLIDEKFQTMRARQVAHGFLDDISTERSELLRRLSEA